MVHLQLFTDGSIDTRSNVGVGAYLLLSETNTSLDSLHERVKLKRFDNSSSTKLELQTLLWALRAEEIGDDHILTIYTDSQNIISLPGRQARLESSNYISRNNKPLANAKLYQEFYQLTDGWFGSLKKASSSTAVDTSNKYSLVKLKGHKAASEKDKFDHLFSLVDRAARRGLREVILGNPLFIAEMVALDSDSK
ncbi:MAG: ribonuclease HI [Oleiphilaceae bacterium]|jgi:ribonuclease HI